MFMTRVTIVATVLLTLTVLGTGTGVFLHQALADKPAANEPIINAAAQNNPGAVQPGQPNNKAGVDFQGKLKKVDVAKGTLTLEFPPLNPGGNPNVPGGEIQYTVTKEIKIVDKGGKEIAGGLKHKFFEKAGSMVTITLEPKNGQKVLTKITIPVDPAQ